MNRMLQVTSCIAGVLFFTLSVYAAEITIGTGTSAWSQPLPTAYHDARTQTIYLASEIGGPKELTSLALNVSTKPGQIMNYFTIRLKHTDLSSYDSNPAWESSGWTTVYQANTTISTIGWVTFPFTTPFVYNGTQNLMVDISFNNSSYTTNGWCYYTSSSVNRSIYYKADSDYGDPLTWSSRIPTPNVTTRFPNIRLGSNVIFNPDGGTYNTEPNVVITCATPGATIRYTLDGSDPNSGTIIASGSSVFIDHTLTLKAVAWKDGFPYSAKSASYQLVVATPVFTPDGGQFLSDPNVVITCSDLNATIHYTTNGLDPNQSDPVIENGGSVVISVAPPTILKVQAFRTDWLDSNIKTALYRHPSIKYGGGTGTEEDPYLIFDPILLQEIGANPADWGKHFKLLADIDMSSYSATQYNIIGNRGVPFTGSFDGDGHIISNLTIITDANDIGLVGGTDNATIKNLGIENVNISGGDDHIGGLVGRMDDGTLCNCYVTGSIHGTNYCVGGLVGGNYQGTIISCYATGSVSGTGHYVGGLVGGNYQGTIISCYTTGSVNGTGSYVGGLVGRNDGSITGCYTTGSVNGSSDTGGLVGQNNFGSITSCYATGSVSGTGHYVGGLMGENDHGTIISCYATSSVNGTGFDVGGLVGVNYHGSLNACYATGSVSGTGFDVGGLVGGNYHGSLNACYATGSVSGTGSYVGGLLGYNDSGSIIACFWDTETSGRTTSAGGTGKTTAEMKTLSTFTNAGWDFSTTDGDPADWCMPTLPDYPKLAWNYYPHPVGLNEFKLLSQYWLMSGCIDAQPCAVADWHVDGTIDILDLDVLVEYWLSGYIEKQYPPLAAYWPMDESSGSVVSDAAGLHNGQLVNMDSNTCWTAGHINNALQFDGINDYVQITGYKGILGSQARTCAAWIKATSTGQHQIALSWGGPDPTLQTWYFGGIFTAPNTTELAIGVGSNSYVKCSATPFDNQWHHVAVVLSDDDSPTTSEIKLYLDGQLRTDTTIFNGTVAINTSGTRDVYLGAYTGNTTPTLFFKGLLDDVRMYNYALSDAEITALAQ